MQQVAIQQALVNQSLSVVTASTNLSQFGSLSSTLSVARRVMQARRAQGSTGCVSGENITTTQTGPNTYSITVQSYYDTNCAVLWFTGQFTLTQT
ncbi:MAG: hypothetical protein ACREMT_04645, partial [Vulcanimicrobiaceae bacterium]